MFKLIPSEIREAFAKEDDQSLDSIKKKIMDFYGIKERDIFWKGVFRDQKLFAFIPFPTFDGPRIYTSANLRGPNVFQKFNCAFMGGKPFGGIPVISPYEWWLYLKPHMSSRGIQFFLRDSSGISRSVRWEVRHEAVTFHNWRDYDFHMEDRRRN